MNDLIERYLQVVGRALPANRRRDILAELRSALYDAVEGADDPTAAAVTAIKQMGPPHAVAAAYDPAGGYLIGPQLFPTFRLVLGIVVVATIGAQLLGIVLALTLAGAPFDPGGVLLDLIGGLPAALGMVVVIFWLLQRLGVNATQPAAPFDPLALPPLEREVQPVGRFGQLLSILIGVVFLTLLTQFGVRGGFAWVEGRNWFENPVIHQYFVPIVVALLVGIVIDIVVLWQGRWTRPARLAAIGSELLSLVVLGLLVAGHHAWFRANGLPNMAEVLTALPTAAESGQLGLVGMWGFYIAFSVAALVAALELGGHLVRLVWSSARPLDTSPVAPKPRTG